VENGLKIYAMLKNNKSTILSGNCWSGKTTTIQMLVAALHKNKTLGFSSIKVDKGRKKTALNYICYVSDSSHLPINIEP